MRLCQHCNTIELTGGPNQLYCPSCKIAVKIINFKKHHKIAKNKAKELKGKMYIDPKWLVRNYNAS